MTRKTLFKIMAMGERLLQQKREIDLNSKYNWNKWGFITSGQNKREDGQLQ